MDRDRLGVKPEVRPVKDLLCLELALRVAVKVDALFARSHDRLFRGDVVNVGDGVGQLDRVHKLGRSAVPQPDFLVLTRRQDQRAIDRRNRADGALVSLKLLRLWCSFFFSWLPIHK